MTASVGGLEGQAARALENLATAVLVFDERLKLAYINPAGEMLFSVGARHARGVAIAELVPETLAVQVRDALQGASSFTKRELSLQVALDRTVTVDCTVTPLLDAGNAPAILLELQQVDHQLRVSREENLLVQQQAARDLVRGLAHEIKNPLGGLRGAAQLLERELDDIGLQEYTRIIIGEADRLQKLVDRLLGPTTMPEKRHITVHQVLEHVRNLVEAEGGESLRIQRDYDPSIPDLFADPEMLIQAILNIVRNAAQAQGYAGVIELRTRTKRQFTIGTQRHKLVVQIDVIDDGPGIPPQMLDKIFYPMVSGRPGGTGLGLSIAQNLINRHGGLIECTSEPGCTAFTIYLPLEPLHD